MNPAANIITACILAALASVAVHEYAHCAGAGTPPTECTLTAHLHGDGIDHIIHASDYSPGDHAWIIPLQIAVLVGMLAVIVATAPRWAH